MPLVARRPNRILQKKPLTTKRVGHPIEVRLIMEKNPSIVRNYLSGNIAADVLEKSGFKTNEIYILFKRKQELKNDFARFRMN